MCLLNNIIGISISLPYHLNFNIKTLLNNIYNKEGAGMQSIEKGCYQRKKLRSKKKVTANRYKNCPIDKSR